MDKSLQMSECQKELAATKQRLRNTKYILLLGFLLGPLGLFHSTLTAWAIFAFFLTFWGVSTYISLMHYLAAKKRVEDKVDSQKVS